jgi:hypothetical protein
MSAILLPKFRKKKHLLDKEIQKKRRKPVDTDVYEVIPPDVQASHIVVESKAQTTHRPVQKLGIEQVGVKRFLNRGPGEILHVDIGIEHDVVGVIEMPGTIQRIGIDKKYEKRQTECCKKVCFGWG